MRRRRRLGLSFCSPTRSPLNSPKLSARLGCPGSPPANARTWCASRFRVQTNSPRNPSPKRRFSPSSALGSPDALRADTPKALEGALAVSRARPRRVRKARGRWRGAREEAGARAAARRSTRGRRGETRARRGSCAPQHASRAKIHPYLHAASRMKSRRSRLARRARGGRQRRAPRRCARRGRACAWRRTCRGRTTPRYTRRARAARVEVRVAR
mmetsp:Transcript_5871/g.23772  ORF Transcript_5871/g.23772 Transcript_5871/m.23772 type:complete len:214 (+) Transcript_5871:959-1600(+)